MWFPLAQKHLAKAAALADRAKVLTDFDEIKAEAAYIQGTTCVYIVIPTWTWQRSWRTPHPSLAVAFSLRLPSLSLTPCRVP